MAGAIRLSSLSRLNLGRRIVPEPARLPLRLLVSVHHFTVISHGILHGRVHLATVPMVLECPLAAPWGLHVGAAAAEVFGRLVQGEERLHGAWNETLQGEARLRLAVARRGRCRRCEEYTDLNSWERCEVRYGNRT
eukprot:6607370-Prymnesium_polylepis.1